MRFSKDEFCYVRLPYGKRYQVPAVKYGDRFMTLRSSNYHSTFSPISKVVEVNTWDLCCLILTKIGFLCTTIIRSFWLVKSFNTQNSNLNPTEHLWKSLTKRLENVILQKQLTYTPPLDKSEFDFQWI